MLVLVVWPELQIPVIYFQPIWSPSQSIYTTQVHIHNKYVIRLPSRYTTTFCQFLYFSVRVSFVRGWTDFCRRQMPGSPARTRTRPTQSGKLPTATTTSPKVSQTGGHIEITPRRLKKYFKSNDYNII